VQTQTLAASTRIFIPPRLETNMTRLLKFALITILCWSALMLHAQTAAAGAATTLQLTPDQAKQDVRILKRALTELHPALTKYRTPAEMEAAFAKFEARGNASRTPAEMYLAASELAAAIRCGHTWTNVLNQQGAVKAALLEATNKLPFTLTLVENRWLVLASADAAVQAGDEVMAINGVAAAEMVSQLMPYLRADGSSDGKRLVQLNHDRLDFSQMDVLWPLLSPPVEGKYRVALRRGKAADMTVNVNANSLAARGASLLAQGVKPMDKSWTFRIVDNVGYLTMPSFAFWNSKFDWNKFIDDSFAELNTKRIPHLVIDIRANEGGDGAIGGKVLSHLIDKPFTFVSDQSTSNYERAPYNLAKYLDTWDYRFFDRTGQVEKIAEGTAAGKFRFKPNATGARTIMPTAMPYSGKAYLLVSAENSSATFQFAWLAKQSGAAILVGQQTGGNQRGLNGGQHAWVTAPNSSVSIDIPLLAATYEATTPDASVTPDVIVKRTFEARRAGRDEEMVAVMREIARKL
jgi:C-terminal processing protease CtpA/Prc